MTPVLETEDGRFFHGTRAIFGYLQDQQPWQYAEAHRRRFLDHREARQSDAPAGWSSTSARARPGAARSRPS